MMHKQNRGYRSLVEAYSHMTAKRQRETGQRGQHLDTGPRRMRRMEEDESSHSYRLTYKDKPVDNKLYASYEEAKEALGKLPRYRAKGVEISAVGVPSESTIYEKSSADTFLANKAKDSKYSKSTLKKVYDRGLAAYKKSHRPGTTAHQWAAARVNAFVSGKSTVAGKSGSDSDLAKESYIHEEKGMIGKSLVNVLVSTCLANWYELINKFNARPDVYDIQPSQGDDNYNLFKLRPGSDVKDQAFEYIIDMTNDLTSSLNKHFGKEVFEPRVQRTGSTLETLVAFREGRGGVFQAKANGQGGDTEIALTMPVESQLERAFSAMADVPHPDDQDVETENEFDKEIAGEELPDYEEMQNDDEDILGDEDDGADLEDEELEKEFKSESFLYESIVPFKTRQTPPNEGDEDEIVNKVHDKLPKSDKQRWRSSFLDEDDDDDEVESLRKTTRGLEQALGNDVVESVMSESVTELPIGRLKALFQRHKNMFSHKYESWALEAEDDEEFIDYIENHDFKDLGHDVVALMRGESHALPPFIVDLYNEIKVGISKSSLGKEAERLQAQFDDSDQHINIKRDFNEGTSPLGPPIWDFVINLASSLLGQVFIGFAIFFFIIYPLLITAIANIGMRIGLEYQTLKLFGYDDIDLGLKPNGKK